MKIPERYDLVLQTSKLFKLGPFGYKQLKCGVLQAAIWTLIPLSVDWHHFTTYVVVLGLSWYAWVDFFRFVFFKSTWCYRCRKRKIIAWEMMPKWSAANDQWMCIRCHADCAPTVIRIEKSMRNIRGLLSMKWLLRGEESPHGPLPDVPPISESEESEDRKG